jgi:hypothetical protein
MPGVFPAKVKDTPLKIFGSFVTDPCLALLLAHQSGISFVVTLLQSNTIETLIHIPFIDARLHLFMHKHLSVLFLDCTAVNFWLLY